ncbi:GerMN domain-containing protein [Paenibacillus sp. IB182496]|uniref:GerMN domain-containing protein n=1 Tax=Paenibacillus sabuli TaxID=2772509 RepID=A0A927BSR6_9BACL|nr:GerMN domain-containing protein [Paenibacillus sabuli]MBD2845090.1 GerMN domain-containing protein [Paenibacillus sabuli]
MTNQAKKPVLLALLILVAVLAAGCGSRQGDAPPDNNGGVVSASPSNQGGEGENAEAPATDPDPLVRTVYYGNEDGTALVKKPVELAADTPLDDQLAAVLEALQQPSDDASLSLWEKIDILSHALEDGTLTLDIDIPDEARLGSPGEALALDALKQTVFQFEDVEALEVLVGGEAKDSLMGHEELPHPITR